MSQRSDTFFALVPVFLFLGVVGIVHFWVPPLKPPPACEVCPACPPSIRVGLEGTWTTVVNDTPAPVYCYVSPEMLATGDYAVRISPRSENLPGTGGAISLEQGKLICVVDVTPPALENP